MPTLPTLPLVTSAAVHLWLVTVCGVCGCNFDNSDWVLCVSLSMLSIVTFGSVSEFDVFRVRVFQVFEAQGLADALADRVVSASV